MIPLALSRILHTFDANVASTKELMKFDQLVLELAVSHLRTLQERLTKVHGIENARFDVANTLALLQNIHQNDSLDPHYREMLNQCNVLLVSYFSAAVGDIFRTSVTEAVREGTRPTLLKEDIKLGLRDVREVGSELQDRVGELFVAHKDISFQDMQSIGRSFRDYFDYDPPKDEVVNDIIMSQACRHAIVHSGGVVDRKMLTQVKNANPRRLKPTLRESERLQFSEDEIVLAGDQMRSYLQDLVVNVTA